MERPGSQRDAVGVCVLTSTRDTKSRYRFQSDGAKTYPLNEAATNETAQSSRVNPLLSQAKCERNGNGRDNCYRATRNAAWQRGAVRNDGRCGRGVWICRASQVRCSETAVKITAVHISEPAHRTGPTTNCKGVARRYFDNFEMRQNSPLSRSRHPSSLGSLAQYPSFHRRKGASRHED